MNVVVALLLGMAALVLGALATGFAFMIVLGVLHSVNPAFPAFGFIECYLLTLLGGIATSKGTAEVK